MKNKNSAAHCALQLSARLLMAFMVFLTASCTSEKPAPRTQSITITLQTAEDINPDDKGRAKPVHIAIWLLTQTDAFMAGDYFSFMDGSDQALSEQGKKQFDMIMMPNEKRQIALELPASTMAIGVIASWRDIKHSRWKALTDIPQEPHKRWYKKLWSDKRIWQPRVYVRMKHLTTTIEKMD